MTPSFSKFCSWNILGLLNSYLSVIVNVISVCQNIFQENYMTDKSEIVLTVIVLTGLIK